MHAQVDSRLQLPGVQRVSVDTELCALVQNTVNAITYHKLGEGQTANLNSIDFLTGTITHIQACPNLAAPRLVLANKLVHIQTHTYIECTVVRLYTLIEDGFTHEEMTDNDANINVSVLPPTDSQCNLGLCRKRF